MAAHSRVLAWGAWWAAVNGVAQSLTRLKWLSSSSSCLAGEFFTVWVTREAHTFLNVSSKTCSLIPITCRWLDWLPFGPLVHPCVYFSILLVVKVEVTPGTNVLLPSLLLIILIFHLQHSAFHVCSSWHFSLYFVFSHYQVFFWAKEVAWIKGIKINQVSAILCTNFAQLFREKKMFH